ncbi:hypothetical protein J6590_040102 [Homalodisca vitripennis]|nr:hypothetical protein J6590_040102 [Homalodisca vitripennis]
MIFLGCWQKLAEETHSGGVPVVCDSNYWLSTEFTLQTVTEHDVIRQVNGLRRGSAPGMVGVSTNRFKESIDVISQQLTRLIN